MNKNQQIVICKTKDGQIQVDVQLQDETIWLTQKRMAILFGTEVPAISKHIKNIYKTKELDDSATLSKMETVQLVGIPDNLKSNEMCKKSTSSIVKNFQTVQMTGQ